MSIDLATRSLYDEQSLDIMSLITYNVIMIIEIYQDENGREPFTQWLYSIKDIRTRARIDNRLERLRVGNLGDFRSLGRGLFELRLHFGPGYRIYCGRMGDEIVVLLSGGDKGSQTIDIQRAQQFWSDYKRSR
jgi:putative addiction module killer protein